MNSCSSVCWFRLLRQSMMLNAALVLVLALQPAALADFVIFANSTSNLGNGPPSTQGSSGTVSDTAGGTVGTDITEAFSSATFGQLKAYSYVKDETGGATNGTFAYNNVYYRDNYLFNKAGLTGAPGTVEMKFTVEGSLAASRTANSEGYISGADDSVRAFAEYTFSPGGGQPNHVKFEGVRTSQYATGTGFSQQEGTPFLNVEQTFIVPFTYGTVLENVGLRLFVGAQGFGAERLEGFSSISIADLAHTANWGGFGAVRDADGNLVTDYEFTSGSGFDYTRAFAAVPEPSSLILLTTGAALCVLRRSRSSRASHG